MTVPEVAAYLKMSKSKVYYLIKRREIPHIRIGRNVRVRGKDLEDWLKTKVEGQVTFYLSHTD
jgi:excisionase family DNA binding protein